jgi:hypothetical protein
MGLTAIDAKATLSSFSNNQFTLNWSSVYTTTRFYTFALVLYGTFQGASFSNSSPTSTGNQNNTVAFSPSLAFVQSLGTAASTSAQTSGVACYSAGCFNGTSSRVSALDIQGPGGKSNSTAKSYYQSTQMLEMYDTTATTPVKLVEASGNSLSSGSQLNFTTVNATARQYIGWAMGSGSGGGGGGGPFPWFIDDQCSGGVQTLSSGL